MEGGMKVHQFAHGFLELHEGALTCKRLRPLVDPKLTNNDTTVVSFSPFDIKTFIKPESGPRKLGSSEDNRELNQVEAHPGGTRWNPTQEQIGILEMLYRGGTRTPNAQQIEKITAQLAKYGKIEGKNVFYWFQNHKARERQKQKRNILGLSHSSRTSSANTISSSCTPLTLDIWGEVGREDSTYKRKCRSWSGFEWFEEDKRYCKDEEDRTLELFPLHPEGK